MSPDLPAETLRRDAVATLTGWRPDSLGQESLRQTYLAYLAARADSLARGCAAGHLTASTAVFDAERRHVLLTLHPRVGRWIQLGGHCEETDETLAGAALREAREESGIEELRLDPVPIQLDTHPVTCSLGVPTRHLDVRFLAVVPPGAEPVRSDESDDLRWWPVDALPAGDTSLDSLVAAAVTRTRMPTL